LKHFTCKWLKRFSVLIAIKLFIIATCLTLLRILFVSIADYKEDLTTWLASEYNINLSVEHISAGVDFSGLILTLDDVELVDSADLPFQLQLDYLFLHLDFWNSVKEQNLSFTRISLQGVDVTVKKSNPQRKKSEQALLTIDALQRIFLDQFDKLSVKESRIHFNDHLGNKKTIFIEKLRWLNNDDYHQGIGSASLVNGLRDNSLAFVVKLLGERGNQDDPIKGALYIEADNLNITNYLTAHVNPNAQILDAVLGFQVWAEFSLAKLDQVQIALNDSKLAWSQSNKLYNWQLNSGLLQFSNSEQGWLFDSYYLDIEKNHEKLKGLALSGSGTSDKGAFDFTALNLKDLLPFYLLTSELTQTQTTSLQAFDLDADIKRFAVTKNNDHKLQFNALLNAFKNRPDGAVPGLSNANIELSGNATQGEIKIELPKQKIYFDGQFSRAMPVESGDIELNWLETSKGLKLFSDHSLLSTSDIDTNTRFSLLFPNKQAKNQSPFLSLYSYASLNDAGKAQYYFPIQAMGDKVFGYLEPTLKAGKVTGAQILWYGAFNHYPYNDHDGIFQAKVPLRGAQYDFYGQWQGLTGLDLDLLFENDGLTMESLDASLGEVKVQKLSAKIDHLNPDGILTINADISEDAQKISDYLKASPLKESVGNALNVINLHNQLSGQLALTIPFNSAHQQTETVGAVTLSGNNIDIKLADNIVLPLKKARGEFAFINGDIVAKNINARLFDQNIQFSFDSTAKKQSYQVNVDMTGRWKLDPLKRTLPALKPLQLSGILDWTGEVDFEYSFAGGYQYKLVLNSATQGISSQLPAPFNKNLLQSWPSNILVSGSQQSSTFTVNIKDKLNLTGELNYQDKKQTIPYFTLNVGAGRVTAVDSRKHIININLEQLNITDWYEQWDKFRALKKGTAENLNYLPIELDQIIVDIKHATFFEQPLSALKVNAINDKQKWSAAIDSDNLQGALEYRFGVPVRLDFDIKKINFKAMDLSTLNSQRTAVISEEIQQSDNLIEDYPEIFAECATCIFGDFDFSPLELHLYPTKSRLAIDYIKIGTENEFTHISGGWDQRRTNMIIDSLADEHNSLVSRLGFVSPVVHQNAEFSGAFNWIGAPWQFNYGSLNGDFSALLKNGSITEVSDNGARLLSIFSLDGIRRSLNLEFGNVFAKGFNFNELTFSAKITDGVIKNDDFYLNGSAGKIVGNGLVDLANNETNYKFSYSPAVTSSLPVLTAFAINPLTGAAVLLLSKIIEPVVETVIRVDFSVKGPLNEPEIKLINRQSGKVKLQNSEVLETINGQQLNSEYGSPDGL
jgi:uncharacterized protein (TIGR02099 family)